MPRACAWAIPAKGTDRTCPTSRRSNARAPPAPLPGETVIDKPGFGAFYTTDLELILRTQGISHLTIAGVTTDLCVHSTLREAVDRGFDCTTVGDACAAGDPDLHEAMLAFIAGEGGILGRVVDTRMGLDLSQGRGARGRQQRPRYAILKAQRFLQTDRIFVGISLGRGAARMSPKLLVRELGKRFAPRGVAALETAGGGEILVDGHPVAGPGRARTMVFQDYSLYPWLSVLENIRFGLTLKADRLEPAPSGAERAGLLLELMGLEGVRDLHPQALSGGMRQRVAIARALLGRAGHAPDGRAVRGARCATRGVMHDLILHILAHERSTMLFFTHDVEEAVYLADRVIVLAPAPGRIDSVWCPNLPPALERRQRRKRSPEFLGLEEQIVERIRATSALQSDSAALHRFTAAGS